VSSFFLYSKVDRAARGKWGVSWPPGVNKKVFLCLSWAKNWAKVKPELTGLKMALPPSFYLIPRVATRGMSSYRLAIADSHMQLDRGRVRVLGAALL
jgi:hypothetical protein